MINIFVSIELNKIKFFNEYNDLFKKYNINFHSSLKDCHIVLFFYNLGKPKNFRKEILNLFQFKKKYDLGNEERCIKYLIEKLGKKIIIYYRCDGTGIRQSIHSMREKYNDLLFIIRDYILKEEKEFLTIKESYSKYLMHKHFENENVVRNIEKIIHSNFKYFCYTFPYFKFVGYGYLDDKRNISKQEKKYDIFFIKNYREGQLNCLLRKKTLDCLLKFNKKHKNKYKICWKPCTKDEYRLRLAQSKICISTWGMGESLRDDYFCIKHDVICFKVNTGFVKDFYGLFGKNSLLHFYHIDFNNFEYKLLNLLNNYNHYYKLHEKNRKELMKKYNLKYHVEALSNKINKEFYDNHNNNNNNNLCIK